MSASVWKQKKRKWLVSKRRLKKSLSSKRSNLRETNFLQKLRKSKDKSEYLKKPCINYSTETTTALKCLLVHRMNKFRLIESQLLISQVK